MLPSLPSLELICFGPPSARLAGTAPPKEVLWRKHFALLAYLALSPSRSRTRAHLVGLFWSEQPERKARKSLDMALHRLRGVLGESRLTSANDAVVLSAEALDVDVLQFVARATVAPDHALALLRGAFLEGFHIDDAPEFEDWMSSERERYRTLATGALVAMGERRLTESRLEEAADLAHRALALEPRLEPAVRLLMRSRMLAGDSATALAAYQGFSARLKEFGELPNRALAGLADRIRSEASHRRETAVSEPPLVGREQTHRAVFETVERGIAAGLGAPRTLLITGPPGAGRSRLMAESLRRAGVDGALTIQARALESDQDAPWSALRLLIRAGLGGARGLPGAPGPSLAALADIVPELAERFPARPVRDVADMASALAEALRAVAVEQPVVIGLDDAHWADGPSVAAMAAAMSALKTSPVVLVITVAQGAGEPPHELLRLQSDIGRDVPGLTVRLGVLDHSDLASLVLHLAPWCRDATDRDRLTRRLAVETEGNPFFAVTLLHALAKASTLQADFVTWPPPHGTHGAPPPFSVPSAVRQAIVVRVGELSPEELTVLRAASVCGQVLDMDLIAHVADVPASVVEHAVPTFERRHLVRFDGTRTAFAASLIAEVVRTECLTRSQRRTLEQRAVDALAMRPDLESRVLRAELLAHTAPSAASYGVALEVARDALDAGARRTAQRAIAAGGRIANTVQVDGGALEALTARLKY